MSVIRDNKWRKILEENFPPKFIVKISNGRGYGVFDFDGNFAKVVVDEVPEELKEEAIDALEGCPVDAIREIKSEE